MHGTRTHACARSDGSLNSGYQSGTECSTRRTNRRISQQTCLINDNIININDASSSAAHAPKQRKMNERVRQKAKTINVCQARFVEGTEGYVSDTRRRARKLIIIITISAGALALALRLPSMAESRQIACDLSTSTLLCFGMATDHVRFTRMLISKACSILSPLSPGLSTCCPQAKPALWSETCGFYSTADVRIYSAPVRMMT